MKKILLQIALGIISIILVYFIYESIMGPVRFNQTRSEREAKIIEKLKDIRNVQIAFKSVYGRYSSSFDTLIDFLEHGYMPIVLKKGTVPDSLTEAQALKLKIITRDTSRVLAKDSLFGNRKDFNIKELALVPTTNGKKFEINAGKITKGSFQVPVFEVCIPFKEYLGDLDKNLLQNLIQAREDINQYPGLKVGSMLEPSTDGNWE